MMKALIMGEGKDNDLIRDVVVGDLVFCNFF